LRDSAYVEQEIDLADGDLCVFVTDGISEALDDGVRTWRKTVLESFGGNGRPSAESVSQTILAAAERGPGPEGVEDWTDDRTVIVLRVTGPTPSPRS
jgi:serine phosphatase RsbU (regulator of sigma subunit)